MIVDVVTLFPEMFSSVLEASLVGKAVEKGLFSVRFTNPRDFVEGKPGGRRQVDDTPYGGGAGMVLRPEPLVAAIEHAQRQERPRTVLLCPSGRPLTQATVARYAELPRLLLVCGRYEGFDDRVRHFVDEELSIGDYVLTGGELGAMVVIDAVARRLPGVLGNAASPLEESFESGLLEYPQYTRPANFRGFEVPAILLGGNHEQIRRWRRREALRRTQRRRPELLERLTLSGEDRQLLESTIPPPGKEGE